jgi:hypothetical protein
MGVKSSLEPEIAKEYPPKAGKRSPVRYPSTCFLDVVSDEMMRNLGAIFAPLGTKMPLQYGFFHGFMQHQPKKKARRTKADRVDNQGCVARVSNNTEHSCCVQIMVFLDGIGVGEEFPN